MVVATNFSDQATHKKINKEMICVTPYQNKAFENNETDDNIDIYDNLHMNKNEISINNVISNEVVNINEKENFNVEVSKLTINNQDKDKNETDLGNVNNGFKNEESCYQVKIADVQQQQKFRRQAFTLREEKNGKKYQYGWCCIRSNLLQKLNKPIFFVIFLCMAAFSQGLVVTGISFTVITSIEKQFGLTSTEVGLFGTSYDISYGLCCFFVGYVGHKHKPRWIGIGIIIMAIAAFLFTIPKYIYGKYNVGVVSNQDFCLNFGNSTIKEECEASTQWYYKFFFFLSNILMGIGAIPLATLGTAYLYEISDRAHSGIYIALFYASALFGPGLGFIIGLPILNTWVDIEQPAGSHLTNDNKNWVGAWWVGYIIGSIILIIPAIPMLGFPRSFRSNAIVQKRRLDDAVQENSNLRHDLKSLWPATKDLLKNNTFIFICLGGACETLSVAGFSTFISKFIETQFHFTSSNSSLYTGLIILPGAAIGIITGGYLMRRFSWTCKKTLKISSFIAAIAVLPMLSALVGCSGRDVVGATVPYIGGNLKALNLTNVCNINCDCTILYYKPICSVEKQETFFSPCHAGCKKENQVGDKFTNCSCIASTSHAVEGRCKADCNYFPIFAIGMFLMVAIGFLNNVPILHCVFRVIPEGQGSFAMGFQQVFVRFLGFIPAPTLFGSLIDTSCKLWQPDQCTGNHLNCLEYDNEDFRLNLFILGVATKFFTFIFIFLAYKSYQPPKNTPALNSHAGHESVPKCEMTNNLTIAPKS